MGLVALFRRERAAAHAIAARPRREFSGWLTGTLVWLAALLGMLLLVGAAVLAVQIRGGMLPPPARLWSQFPALVFGHLPAYQPTMPLEAQVIAWLPYAVLFLAVVAGMGIGQAWRARRWSLVARVLLTVVIALLLLLAVLII